MIPMVDMYRVGLNMQIELISDLAIPGKYNGLKLCKIK